MVLKWFRGKSGDADAGGAKPAGDPVEYNGFTIQPAPQKTGGGWNTAGIISKEIGGEVKTHNFIRVDTHSSKDDAISFAVVKGQQIIDEQGDALFTD